MGRELTWPPLEDVAVYRVLVRNLATSEFVIKEPVMAPRWRVPDEILEQAQDYAWRVQWLAAGDEDWREFLPDVPLNPPAPVSQQDASVLEWDDTGAFAYRILIRRDGDDDFLLKVPVTGTSHTVDWSGLDRSARYRWRLQEWDLGAGDWRNLSEYAALSRPGVVVESPASQAGKERGDGSPSVLLLFTTDTEVNLRYSPEPDPRTAVDEHIYGRVDGREAGIGTIMDALEQRGFRGTFFLDILAEYQLGEGALEPVVETILARGHDIQLHLHTAPHLRFAEDPALHSLANALPSRDADRFRRALELAFDLFVARVGHVPVAYRSGAYHICDAYFPVLEEFGLAVDSSIFPFKNCSVSPWMRARTQPFRIGSLLEVPVTWGVEWRDNGPIGLQFAPRREGGDNQASFTSMQPVLAGGPPVTLVYLAHSYQYLTRGPDIGPAEQATWRAKIAARVLRSEHVKPYESVRPGWFFEGPDQSRIDLLHRNLDELAARGDVKCVTMADLAVDYLEAWDVRTSPVDIVPETYFDPVRAHSTGTRVYSLDYLRNLA